MKNETQSHTDGSVGSQKEPFVGTDNGTLPDEQKLPDENPVLMETGGSPRQHDSGESGEGEPNAGTSTTLTDARRHSGTSGDEDSIES